jgi:hypothetical protein
MHGCWRFAGKGSQKIDIVIAGTAIAPKKIIRRR